MIVIECCGDIDCIVRAIQHEAKCKVVVLSDHLKSLRYEQLLKDSSASISTMCYNPYGFFRGTKWTEINFDLQDAEIKLYIRILQECYIFIINTLDMDAIVAYEAAQQSVAYLCMIVALDIEADSLFSSQVASDNYLMHHDMVHACFLATNYIQHDRNDLLLDIVTFYKTSLRKFSDDSLCFICDDIHQLWNVKIAERFSRSTNINILFRTSNNSSTVSYKETWMCNIDKLFSDYKFVQFGKYSTGKPMVSVITCSNNVSEIRQVSEIVKLSTCDKISQVQHDRSGDSMKNNFNAKDDKLPTAILLKDIGHSLCNVRHIKKDEHDLHNHVHDRYFCDSIKSLIVCSKVQFLVAKKLIPDAVYWKCSYAIDTASARLYMDMFKLITLEDILCLLSLLKRGDFIDKDLTALHALEMKCIRELGIKTIKDIHSWLACNCCNSTLLRFVYELQNAINVAPSCTLLDLMKLICAMLELYFAAPRCHITEMLLFSITDSVSHNEALSLWHCMLSNFIVRRELNVSSNDVLNIIVDDISDGIDYCSDRVFLCSCDCEVLSASFGLCDKISKKIPCWPSNENMTLCNIAKLHLLSETTQLIATIGRNVDGEIEINHLLRYLEITQQISMKIWQMQDLIIAPHVTNNRQITQFHIPYEHRPKRIAATSFRALINNPALFCMKNILGLKKTEDILSNISARNFGIVVHDMARSIAELMLQCKKSNIFNKEKILHSCMSQYRDQFNILEFSRLQFYANALYQFHSEIFARCDEYLPETSGSINMLDVNLVCIADSIAIYCDCVEIYDYKTGWYPSVMEAMSGLDPQLFIEAIIMQDNGFLLVDSHKAQVSDMIYLTLFDDFELKISKFSKSRDIIKIADAINRARKNLLELLKLYYIDMQSYVNIANSSVSDVEYDHLLRTASIL